MLKKEQVESWLENNLYEILYDDLFPKVEQFDFSYLDQLGWVLYEKFGATKGKEKLEEISKLLEVKIVDFKNVSTLAKKIEEIGIKKEDFSPKKSTDEFKTRQEYKTPKSWDEVKNKTAPDGGSQIINKFQAEYSIKSINKPYSGIKRAQIDDFWTEKIKNWIDANLIDMNKFSTSIGCRWAEEIKYFRSIGLKNMFGLDLFSQDENLVKIGDVHNLSFENNSFSFIYTRNTFNKLFDVRKAFEECVRVLSNGGILAYDDVQGYTHGVNELARTNIINNEWIIQHLKARGADFEVLHSKQADECQTPYSRTVGMLALKINK